MSNKKSANVANVMLSNANNSEDSTQTVKSCMFFELGQ